MKNQFNSRLYWRRLKIFAVDDATGAICVIEDKMDGSTKPVRWWIVLTNKRVHDGRSRDERAARAAVRRRVEKLPLRAEAVR